MAHIKAIELEKQREKFKKNYGVDIMTREGRLLLKNELYKRDKVKFINDLVCIEDRDSPGIVIDFKLWKEQQEALKLINKERFVLFLKARQLGFTWLALADSSHDLIFNPGYSVNSISQTEDPDVKELIRRMGFILKYLPNWLIVDEQADPEKKAENITGITYTQKVLSIIIHRPDGEDSVFKGFSSSPGAARSFTANKVILDEWAFHPMAQEIWDAAFPTINRPTGGKVIGISTMERNTLFDEMWQGATWEFGAEKGAGRNSFKGIFIPWHADPRRDEKWYEETKRNMPHTYKKEYPSTPADAYSIGQGAAFTEWDTRIHVPYEKDWYPPYSWRIVFAYDGGYNQAAGMWFAISPDGWAIGFREYYPSHIIDPEQAQDIKALSRDPDGVPEQIDYMVGDTSCWAKNQDSGKSTIEIMEEYGNRPWRQADKDRIMGWRRLHEWLAPMKDKDGNLVKDKYGKPLAKLRFTASCSNFIRLIPGIKVHSNKPDDIADGQEDHLLDVARYFVMSRPRPKMNDEQKKAVEEERRKRIKARSSVTGY